MPNPIKKKNQGTPLFKNYQPQWASLSRTTKASFRDD